MPLLFQYLLRLFLNGVLRMIGLFVVLFFLIDGIESMRRFAQKGAFRWGDMALLLASRLPGFITLLLPSITLLAVLVVVTRLSRHHEITIMRTSGISYKRILIPFLLGGVLVAALQLFFQDRIIPQANRVAQNMEDRLLGRIVDPQVEVDVDDLWLRSDKQLIHVQQILPAEQVLLGVTVFQFDSEYRLRSRLEADSAKQQQGKWLLFQGAIYHYGEQVTVNAFSQWEWEVSFQTEQLQRTLVEPEFLSLKQMYALAERTEREGYDATRLRVLLYSKLTQPLTILSAILLAFPFTLRLPRGGGITRSLALGLLLVFFMFVVTDLAKALGTGGRLPPLLAAWAPVLFFAGIGGFLFLHLANPRRP